MPKKIAIGLLLAIGVVGALFLATLLTTAEFH